MKSQQKAYLLALLSVLFWSTAATAFKIALSSYSFLQILLIASITTVIILFFYLLITKQLHNVYEQKTSQIVYAMVLGFLNPFLYYVILLKAYSILPAQIAQPLNYTWPIVLVLLSAPILKQKLKLQSIVASIISFLGVFVISTQGNLFAFEIKEPLGVLLASTSSIVWASFWLLNVKSSGNEVVKLFLNFCFGSVFILAAVFMFDSLPDFSQTTGLLASVYIGLFEMGITFVIWLKALTLTQRSDKISNLVFLSPFFALFFIHFVLGENIFITTVIGLMLIVVGIFVQRFETKKS